MSFSLLGRHFLRRVSTSAFLFALALLVLADPRPGRGQCLPLEVLTAAAVAGGPPAAAASLRAQLPTGDWESSATGTAAPFWQFVPGPDEKSPADALPTRLELRRVNQEPTADVVLKTSRRACLTELRAALRRAGLKPEPVTCPQCVAERFSTPTYSVTLYQQPDNFAAGKAPYPYLVVVHPLAAGSGK